jgi:2TM domain
MKDEEKDAKLWQQAKARAEFKTHLSIYVIVNAMLWAIWFFTGGVHTHPWPIYPTCIWGVGIISNYFSAYRFGSLAEREYKKLQKE